MPLKTNTNEKGRGPAALERKSPRGFRAKEISLSPLQTASLSNALTAFLPLLREILDQVQDDGVGCMAAIIEQNLHRVGVISTVAERSKNYLSKFLTERRSF